MRTLLLALALGNPLGNPVLDSPVMGQTLNEDHFKPAPADQIYRDPTQEVPERSLPTDRPPVTSVAAPGARLRGLDKMTGRVTEIEIPVGTTLRYERLEITLKSCRRPGPGESEDAFAYLVIRDSRRDAPSFMGWMFASSPALSALDHPRYDVWVAACSTSSTEAPADNAQN
ncbi:MAG: DUF2155 domain-containing protein [Pseudomonadota bacterium]